jgi:hypothetical protein
MNDKQKKLVIHLLTEELISAELILTGEESIGSKIGARKAGEYVRLVKATIKSLIQTK